MGGGGGGGGGIFRRIAVSGCSAKFGWGLGRIIFADDDGPRHPNLQGRGVSFVRTESFGRRIVSFPFIPRFRRGFIRPSFFTGKCAFFSDGGGWGAGGGTQVFRAASRAASS